MASLALRYFVLMLKRATPVEDSAHRLQGGLPPSFPQGPQVAILRGRSSKNGLLRHFAK